MSDKTLEGMVNAYVIGFAREISMDDGMRAALLWLADNVSDEMVEAARNANWHNERSAISAALRAAGGGG